MCGIAGYIGEASQPHLGAVKSMVAAMRHRGPDDHDVLSCGSRVVLGQSRLAILDLSPLGHQPMRDSVNGNVLTFNGEIYNFKLLRKELQDKGHTFATQTDSEVILKAYAQWGVDAFRRLRGIFAFALWDKEKDDVYLVRDQIGVKPLYVFQQGNEIFFASEVRALLNGGVPGRLSKEGLCSFLSYGSVQEPFTLIDGIRSLPPAHWLRITHFGKTEARQYWEPSPISCPPGEFQERISEKLREAIKLQMVSDVPLGAFLSGGIDSSAIVALMRKSAPDAILKTFSIVFEDPRYDERQYARMVAERNQTEHTELLLTGDLVKQNIRSALDAFDQPSVDGLNTWFVSKLVKDAGITVALSGVGGDELFIGYNGFLKPRQLYRAARYLKHLPSVPEWLLAAMGKNETLRKGAQLFGWKQEPYFLSRQVFRDGKIADLIRPNLRSFDWPECAWAWNQVLPPGDAINRISRLELSGYMLSTLLRDSDQMSMAHSLELRVPLIEHELVELLLSIPGQDKLDPVTPKHFLVGSCQDGIPDACIYRRKQGFALPFDQYFKEVFADEIRAFLEANDGGIFMPQALKSLGRDYRCGKISWSRIWTLFVLERYCRKHQMILNV